MHAGIYYPTHNEVAHFHVNGPPNSTEPELQSIAYSLHLHQKTRVIDICTDSNNAINDIIKTQHSPSTLFKNPSHVTLRKIRELTVNRTISKEYSERVPTTGMHLRLFKIAAHSDKNRKNKHKNERAFGHKSKFYTLANKQADIVANSNNNTISHPHPSTHPHNDASSLITLNNKPNKTNIKRTHREKDRSLWLSAEPTKAGRLVNDQVDIKATLTIISNKLQTYRKTGRIHAMAITSSFPTKPTVRRSAKYKADPNKPHYLTYYSDNFCAYCLSFGSKIKESHKHLLCECPLAKEKLDKLPITLLTIINSSLGLNLSTLPWWFHCSAEKWRGTPEVAAELDNFNKELKNRGIIPKALQSFLKRFSKDPVRIKETIYRITGAFSLHLSEIWSDRCKFTFPPRPKPPPPPPPLPPPPRIQRDLNLNTTIIFHQATIYIAFPPDKPLPINPATTFRTLIEKELELYGVLTYPPS